MKAVLLSIRPKWCEMIASGRKTIEVRKTYPKLETPFKVYIYCTCGFDAKEHWKNPFTDLRGKVIGEFVCDNVVRVDCDSVAVFDPDRDAYIEQETCIGRTQFLDYANGHCAFGWHISELKIYDKPKKLSELTGRRETRFGIENFKMQRPPQSWCYVEGETT